MKYNVALMLLVLSVLALAGVNEEKRKSINKNFKVSERTVLEVSNQFGKIQMDTWSKPEIKVDVEIIVNGRNESRAQSLLDKIEIRIKESSSLISLETDFDGNMNTKNEESFEVNYMISLPSENDILVENKFGDIYIGERKGKSEVELSYGNLKTEDFLGPLDLELSFGTGTLGDLIDAEIEVKYGELELNNARSLELEQGFSEVDINQVENLELESKYGDMEIESVDDLRCDVQFSGFSIGRVNKSLYMEANYVSDFEVDELSKDFEYFKFYGKFSSIELNLENGIKADLEVELSFARMNNSYDDMDIYYQDKEDTRSEYKARIGGGSSDKKIIVQSSYGDLRIR